MSTFKFIALRDIPHEFIITMGPGVRLPKKRNIIQRVIFFFTKEKDDLELFFGFVEKRDVKLCSCCGKRCDFTHVVHFDKPISYEELAVALEQQPSKGEARKNGWKGPIPEGYTEFKRKYHRFYILNLPKEI